MSLFERERELACIDELLAHAVQGHGRSLLVEGSAGIGKSALLDATKAAAATLGMRILTARCAELEQNLGFGAVRQLLEDPLYRASNLDRANLLKGPASPAEEALGRVDPGAGDPEVDDRQRLHGIYWLLENLSASGPVAALVDDVQWCDAASLRWIAYIARRIDSSPIFLFVAHRDGEGGPNQAQLQALQVAPGWTVLHPAPLGSESVSRLVRDRAGEAADDSFCQAVFESCGGNPFFTEAVVDAVIADGIPPSAREARRVIELGPVSIRRSVVTRVGRLGSPPAAVARAAAVLGTNSPVADVAKLAGLSPQEASEAADRLAEASILRRSRPLEFAHPVLRTAIYDDISIAERSRLHRAAANMLKVAGASLDKVALHYLVTEPQADAAVVRVLREAAAMSQAPETAISYLRRALLEPPVPEVRPAVLAELGRAEAIGLDPLASDHLGEAMALAKGTVARARLALPLANAHFLRFEIQEMRQVCLDAIGELRGEEGDEARELGLLLRAVLLRHIPEDERHLGESFEVMWREVQAAATVGEVALLSRLASLGMLNNVPAPAVRGAARRVLASPHLVDMVFPAHTRFNAIWALEFVGELAEAEAHATRQMDAARDRGSPAGLAFAATYAATIALKKGDIAAAEDRAQAALDLVTEHGLVYLAVTAGAALAGAQIEQAELSRAAATLDRAESSTTFGPPVSPSVLTMCHVIRGRLLLAAGQPGKALPCLRAAAANARAGGHDHPSFYSWRSEAAIAEFQVGNAAEARSLAGTELDLARSFGAQVAIGRGLRVSGLVNADIEQLREAVELLSKSDAILEHGRALLDLGGSLRRAGNRTEAEGWLRKSLEIANGCRSALLAEAARAELNGLGFRPRRAALVGVESLTPSELRVASMAARGMTNREIAGALFLTVKTVEKHLGQAYQKLGIKSRQGLTIELTG